MERAPHEGKVPELAVGDSERVFRPLFGETSTAVTVRDFQTWRLLDCNPAALRLYGCRSHEELIGKSPADLAPELQPDGTPSRVAMCAHIKTAMRNGVHRCEWLARRMNGETFVADIRISVIELAGGRRVM